MTIILKDSNWKVLPVTKVLVDRYFNEFLDHHVSVSIFGEYRYPRYFISSGSRVYESVKHHGDYDFKHDKYVKFLETLKAAINGRKVERTDYDYSTSREYWTDSNASDLICHGMYSNHFRIGHEFLGNSIFKRRIKLLRFFV